MPDIYLRVVALNNATVVHEFLRLIYEHARSCFIIARLCAGYWDGQN